MNTQSTISAFQSVLTKFRFIEPVNFPEAFAQKRYLKKMERPDSAKKDLRRVECFDRWIQNDRSLPPIVLPPKEWYEARLLIHKWVKEHWSRHVDIDFPRGSEVTPTRGFNSIESRLLKSQWTCTPENIEAFAKLVYGHKALYRAFRHRYTRWYQTSSFVETLSYSNRLLWSHFKEAGGNVGYNIFRWKFQRIITVVNGSRFSTVPKNNEKDRPINVEPFGNILVQRVIGNKIRCVLDNVIGRELNDVADDHRQRIKDTCATIDLSDASDSISMDLVRFLLPPWLVEELEHARSQMTLGLDGDYHVTRKISSMGNGFTFELMTLIFTALCRVLDSASSVFGDDMIVNNPSAPRLCELLSAVGLKVNSEKSFINSPFRESCGANFHDDFGYIESYDFKYPVTIHDCMVVYNKAKALSLSYESFRLLERSLLGFIPKALRGGPFLREMVRPDWISSTPHRDLSCFFMTGSLEKGLGNRDLQKKLSNIASMLCYDVHDVRPFTGVRFVEDLRSPTLQNLRSRHWAKYEMYLHGGRRTKDVITGLGHWVFIKFVRIGERASRLSAFNT